MAAHLKKEVAKTQSSYGKLTPKWPSQIFREVIVISHPNGHQPIIHVRKIPNKRKEWPFKWFFKKKKK